MSGCLFRIEFTDGRVEERRLGDGSHRLGRDAGDVVLGDPASSGVHGQLDISGASVTYADLGSSNGSFDAAGNRLSSPLPLEVGTSVRLATTVITLLETPPTAGAAAAVAATQAMPQVSPAAAPIATAPVRVAAAAAGGNYSHPDQSVRHSYPLAIQSASIGEAMGLLMKTLPFVLVRLGVLVGLTILAIVYWGLLVGGGALLSKVSSVLTWAWVIALLGVGGALWRFFVRYLLYLIKLAHIAVLTELITTGQVGNGSESMFQYGKRVVTERFGEVNVMFGLDLLIDGIVRAFNRTLNWVANLLPVPGLDSAMGVVRAVLRASTTYIDETIFSYNLARQDDNVFRSSRDGLIYYAQNAKEVLKTGLWVVVLDKVLSVLIWIVMLAPAFVIGLLIPNALGSVGTLTTLGFAVLFAGSVRSAFLRPLFLTMVMIKFHSQAQGQAINPEWDSRLEQASSKFGELKQKAEAWMRPGSAKPVAGSAQPA